VVKSICDQSKSSRFIYAFLLLSEKANIFFLIKDMVFLNKNLKLLKYKKILLLFIFYFDGKRFLIRIMDYHL
jgi:hypothetical protein